MIARIAFDDLNATLKAAGEETRLRILCLLAEAELTVSELTEILRQSQPDIAPSQAVGRCATGGTLPRGLVGVFPPGRT